MTLREKLIEAGARALGSVFRPSTEDDAEAALDAFLDCLAENQDEWAASSLPKGAIPVIVAGLADTAHRLLAVLRESDDE